MHNSTGHTILKEWNIFSRKPKAHTGKPASAEKADYGLHVICDRDSEAANSIDIVAVHGLNGHYLKTWTDVETGTNWLKDHIPKIVKSARVMSFSYNSTLQFSKSTSDILTFGDQLLESLLAERNSVEETERPLIFICHSLGGLVFKQAYLRVIGGDKYMTLAKSIRGVFFFGTPHKGSSLATWSTMTARLLRMASLGTSTNTRLSEDLEPDSRLMDYISKSFLESCSSLKINSFYETQKMDYLNSLVVDRDSAVLGHHSETAIPIESDHREMCRFGHIDEKRFSAIKSRLEALARYVRQPGFLEMGNLMKALNTSSYELHKNRNPSPVTGTCTWILGHPKWKAWLESTRSSMLWISADPGCGKSVLASFLVDHFTASSSSGGLNICYFFFKSDNVEQSDVVKGVQAVLHQLYTQQKDIAPSDMRELQGGNLQSVESLWKAFVLSTQDKAARPTICVLDGIDECEPQPRGLLLRCISEYFAAEGDARPNSKLKVIITSRPENQIKVALDKQRKQQSRTASRVPSKMYEMIRLRAEDETDAISDDVNRVITAKIDDLIERGLPIGLLQNLQVKLIKRADRTFLWVSLVLGLLEEKVENGASRRELDDILKTRDIFSVYAELLASRPDLLRARKILNLILAATRALTVEEISIALAVISEERDPGARQPGRKAKRLGKLTFDDIEYELVYPFENHLKHLCGHFIRVIRNKVYFVHETAREFLLAPNNSILSDVSNATDAKSSGGGACDYQQEAFQHTFSLINANYLLLDICVNFLYCLAKPSSSSQPGQTSPETRAFLAYAAQSWTIHHHRVRRRLIPRDTRYYQNLCHPQFPGFYAWMEEFWAPERTPHPPGGAPDDVQDYYIDFFNLETPSLSSHYDGLGEGDDSGTDSDDKMTNAGEKSDASGEFQGVACRDRRADRALLDLPSWRGVEASLSSNPGSLSNHYFPLEVDDDGLVSLKFEEGATDRPPEYWR